MAGSGKNRALDARSAAVEVARTLIDAGYAAYFAGGCVRDRLMGLAPKDYDVATDALPDAVRALFPRAQLVGEAFGVVLVRRGGHQVEVATFRTDGVYSDGRRPEGVTFSDAEHDAKRRDFTINGLFEEPLTGRIIDLVGGQEDLRAGLIRAIGDPASRIREDRLRMLRAVRFAARFGFEIEPATRAAIVSAGTRLAGVSRERIGQEVRMMLTPVSRERAAGLLQGLGLDDPVLLEPHRDVPLPRLGRVCTDEFPTALGAWLLDRHESDSAATAARAHAWSDALVLSNADRVALVRSIEAYRDLRGPWPDWPVHRQKRLAAAVGFAAALTLLRSVDSAAAAAVERRVGELAATGLAPPPLLGGDDLIGIGLAPGPLFRRVLDAVYDAQLDGTVKDRESAVSLAREVARSGGGETVGSDNPGAGIR